MKASCPICKKPVPPRQENPTAPFCSARCRTIDLGTWLGEGYRIPAAGDETEEAAPAPEDEADEPTRPGRRRSPGWRN